MTSTNSDGGAEIQKALEAAFEGVPAPVEQLDLSAGLGHDDLVEMRGQLHLMLPESVHYCLPLILADLVAHHSDGCFPEQDEDLVLEFLDVPSRLASPDRELVSDMYGEAGLADANSSADYLSGRKTEAFALFTPRQAASIVSWLECASTWSCFEETGDELSNALAYWTTRAGDTRNA